MFICERLIVADVLFGPKIQQLAGTIGYKPALVAVLVAAIAAKMRAPADIVIQELLEAAERIRRRAGA